MATERQRPVSDLAGRLHAAAIHLLRRVRREDVAMGLPPGQSSALSVLVFGGARTLSELARNEQVQAPTMSRMVAALEQRGLVERIGDAQDRRRSRIAATAAGARVLREGRARRVRVLARSLASLSKPERATLAAAVDLLERVVRQSPAPRKPAQTQK